MAMTSSALSTTASFVRHWARCTPSQAALRWAGGELTYAELDHRSSQVATALRAEGVGPGDRVAFLDKNSPEIVELAFGAAKVNAVPTPINFRLSPAEVVAILNDSGAAVFVVGSEFATDIDAMEQARTIVTIGQVSGGFEEFSDWRDRHPAAHGDEPQGPGDVGYQLYSSGTTGRPKGVQLTQANIMASLRQLPITLDMTADSVSVVAMPLYHVGGTVWALAGFQAGATNVLVDEIDPPALVDLLERDRITHAFLVPAVLQFMLGVPGVDQRDFSALRYIIYSASPISETVLARSIRTFGCRFVQGYGLTETAGMVVQLPDSDHDPDGPSRHRLRAIGLPVPGADVRIVDPKTGRDLPKGEVGEIWIRGPMVMRGYWRMPEATDAAIRPGGWLRTGDAGYRDGDGYLYIYDRFTDMIVSGGENVYPAEVENVVMSHPGVADVAVIGVPDETWGETPKAIVVRALGRALTEADLIAYCRQRLAGFKCPTSVDWLDALPRNPSGKVLKKDLRAPYWAGRERMVG
jgi:long-chain acyl-CoA synthetase